MRKRWEIVPARDPCHCFLPLFDPWLSTFHSHPPEPGVFLQCDSSDTYRGRAVLTTEACPGGSQHLHGLGNILLPTPPPLCSLPASLITPNITSPGKGTVSIHSAQRLKSGTFPLSLPALKKNQAHRYLHGLQSTWHPSSFVFFLSL